MNKKAKILSLAAIIKALIDGISEFLEQEREEGRTQSYKKLQLIVSLLRNHGSQIVAEEMKLFNLPELDMKNLDF